MPDTPTTRSASGPDTNSVREAETPKVWTRTQSLLEQVGRSRWLVLSLFLAGIIVGLWRQQSSENLKVGGPFEPTEPSRDLSSAGPPESPPQSSASPSYAVGEMHRGDARLREGRYESALAIYQSMSSGLVAQTPDTLRYRIALCLEGLGRWEEAIAEYSAVTSQRTDPFASSAAQVGQARVWMRMRRPAEAKNVLCDLLLRSAEPEFRDRPFLAEARHRLGLVLALEALHGVQPGPLNETAVAHATAELPAEHALDWAASAVDSDTLETESADRPLAVSRDHGTVEEFEVAGVLPRTAASDVLQRLAEASGLECQWTPQSRQNVTGRTASFSVEKLPLSVVLTALSEPLGLLWEISDGALHITSDQEFSQQSLALYRVRIAERVLNGAIQIHQRHALNATAFLELGNLMYAREDIQGAVAMYQRLIAESSRSSAAVESCYNLGVAQRRLGDFAAARESLYQVVDGSPSHVLAPLACLIIGRMYLEEGESDRAIAPLRRATALATGSKFRPAAVIALGTAYLLTDDARATSALVMEHREQLAQPPYLNAAAFLGTFARYRLTTGRQQAQREGRILVWSLLGVARDSGMGPSGTILMGRAYRELGLSERMSTLYEKALQDGISVALVPEMTYEQAEFRFSTGELEAAIESYSSLAAKPDGKWTRLAQLRLAEIYLDDGRLEDCQAWCRRLLQHSESPETPAVLKLMGKAFEQAGDHRQAAICYSGEVPTQ